MNLALVLQGLGSAGFFTSRAFLPALMAALALRYGEQLPWIADSGLVRDVGAAPHWFTSDLAIGVLALLSALELLADKSPDVKSLLLQADRFVKPALAVATTVGVLGASDVAFIEQAVRKGDVGAFGSVVAVGVGALTWWLVTLRGLVLGMLVDADEDDDAGIQKLLSWAEDLWAGLGPWLLLLYPLAVLAVLGLLAGAMVLMRRRAQAKEEAARAPCGRCGAPTYACAPACPACGAAQASPRAVGWLGQSLNVAAADPADHPFRLIEKKRCPTCATRLPERDPRQVCTACGRPPFADAAAERTYTDRVARRLPRTLGITFLLSLVPVLGLIPGVILYRVQLVAPFRRYIPRGRSFVLRWVIRVVFLLLVFGQLVPGFGGLAVPIMALLSYQAYRSSFTSLLAERGSG